MTAILANPRYTERQVWNRQRTDRDLADPANTALGERQVLRWNLPEGWVISREPAHQPLVSEADFIAAQDATAPRGPAGPATRRYLLAGLLTCAQCGRRLESAWSNGKPAYRCRHGYTSATRHDPAKAEEHLHPRRPDSPHLAALAILANGNQAKNGATAQITPPSQAAKLIEQLRAARTVLTYNPATRTLGTMGSALAVTVGQDR